MILELFLVCACATSAQDPPSDPTTADVAHFRLGPAAAVARLEPLDDRFHVVVTVTNDTGGPLWWRGAGIGCIGSGIWTPPRDEDGRARPEFVTWGVGCTLEKDHEPTPEQLAEWRMDPGATRSETLQPFYEITEWDDRAVLRPQIALLVRWVFQHEFTVPRTTPPSSTMDFDCPTVAFAWDRGLGLRAFVDGADGDIDFPHFDPFDATPFFREGPTPIQLGPLTGTAELLPTDPPSVQLTLRNPRQTGITWGRMRPSVGWTGWTEGFLDENDEWLSGGLFCSVAQATADPSFPPGVTRTFTLEPFAHDFLGDFPAPDGRWHWICDSAWPELNAPIDGAPLPATLHVVWDPRHGLAVALRRDARGGPGFEYGDVFARQSAALRVGAGWFIADALRGEPRNLEILLLPVAEQCHSRWDFADLAATEEFRWEDEPPFGAPLPWHPPDPAHEYPRPGDRMDWVVSKRLPMTGFGAKTRRDRSRLVDDDPHQLEAAWEWRRVVLVPLAEPPTSTSGLQAVLLTVQWSPEAGLELTSAPAPTTGSDR